GHGHEQRRQGHFRDVELLKVQLAPEDLGWMGGGARELDAVWLDRAVQHGTGPLVGPHNQAQLQVGHWPSPLVFHLDPSESHQNNADWNARAWTCRLRNTWLSPTCSWSSRLKVQTASGSAGPCTPSWVFQGKRSRRWMRSPSSKKRASRLFWANSSGASPCLSPGRPCVKRSVAWMRRS